MGKRKCWFRDFWQSWGGHIDASALGVILTLCGTILWNTFTFVADTKALPARMHKNEIKVRLINHKQDLEMLRSDRMDGNIRALMRAQHLTPADKTDSEKMLEHRIMAEGRMNEPDESESTNDNSPD